MRSLTFLLLVPTLVSPTLGDSGEVGWDEADALGLRLERVAPLLEQPEPLERLAAVHELMRLAGRRASRSAEVEALLWRAASDPHPRVATLAGRALLDPGLRNEVEPDRRARERACQQRLEWASELLLWPPSDDRSSTDRRAAVRTLVHLAEEEGGWKDEASRLLETAQLDRDVKVAALARAGLAGGVRGRSEALHEGPASGSSESERIGAASARGMVEASRESDRRRDQRFAATSDLNPEVRLASLRWLVEIATNEGVHSDSRLLPALEAHRNDPDPRIAVLVRLALAGLAGDADALRQVYVSP